MKLSVAQQSDAETILQYIKKYYTYDHIAFDPERILPGLRQLLSDPSKGKVFFLEHEENRVGYTIVTFAFDLEQAGTMGIVTDLFIDESQRGKGLGKLTLRALEAECKKLGMNAIELQVENDNHEAKGLYQKCGFTEYDRTLLFKRI